MQASTCPLCASAESDAFLRAIDRFYPSEANYAYRRCRACELVFLSPLPDSEAIASFYGADYAPHAEIDLASLERRQRRPVNRFVIRHRLRVGAETSPWPARVLARVLSAFAMKSTLQPHGGCRLLEVGCGSGGWLLRHQLLGWTVEGTDLSPKAAEAAAKLGLDIFQGGIFEVPRERRYDVISFRHVLEHVPNPRQTLERARELLEPGGSILATLPNLGSLGFQRYGSHWYHLDAPRHLLHFTRASLERLAEAAGLRVASFETEGQPRSLFLAEVYREVYGPDPTARPEAAWRRTCVARCAEQRAAWRGREKWFRRRAALPAWLAGRTGRGEVMNVRLLRR